MWTRRLLFSGAVALIAMLVGCARGRTHVINVKNPEIPNLLVEPLPLTVGVYYEPGFRNYQAEYDAFDRYVVKLGPASVAMFNEIFPQMFKEVVVIEAMPPGPTIRGRVSGILAPRIEDTTMYGMPAVLSYVVTLYSPDGIKMDELYLSGSTYRLSEMETVGGLGPPHIQFAMRSIAAEFIEDFDQNPKVKKWLERSNPSAGKNQREEK